MPGELYFFSLPVADTAKARAFFSDALGWEYEADAGPDHAIITNSPVDFALESGDPRDRPRLYFRVDDVAATASKVRSLGGEAGDVEEGPSGWWADCADNQGLRFMIGRLRPGIATNRTTLTPYLCCKGASDAIDWYVRAFGAREVNRWTAPEGTIGHAEVDILGARFYLSDEWPEGGVLGPAARGGTPVSLVLDVSDADPVFARALAEGAIQERPVTDGGMGFKGGWLKDPWGHRWAIQSTVEDVGVATLNERLGGAFTITGEHG